MISHRHFVHAAFVSVLGFQPFDRMIFGRFRFHGKRWYVVTVRDSQMVHDQNKLGNHCIRVTKRTYRCRITSKSNFKFIIVLQLYISSQIENRFEWRKQF